MYNFRVTELLSKKAYLIEQMAQNAIKHSYFMAAAVAIARKNLSRPQGGPFGACVVRGGRVIAQARNTVLRDCDATRHAEVNAIRLASRKLGRFDLKGCTLYSTTEPCPMCFSAIHWARIEAVYYGTSIVDVKKLGFNE